MNLSMQRLRYVRVLLISWSCLVFAVNLHGVIALKANTNIGELQ